MNDDQICRELSKFRRKTIGKILTRITDRFQYISSGLAIRFYTQVLSQFQEIKGIGNIPSLDEVFTSITDITNTSGIDAREIDTCHGIPIVLKNDVFHMGLVKMIPIPVRELAIYLYDLSLKCPLFFVKCSLWAGRSSHATMMFFYSNDISISIAFYDPHGYSSYIERKNILDPLHGLIFEMSKLTEKKVTFLGPKEVSQYIGMQLCSKENIGFCVSFSYLWLYMVLRTIHFVTENPDIIDLYRNHFEGEDDISLILRYVEYAILKCVPDEELATVVENFSAMLISRYLEYISLKYPIETQSRMYMFETVFSSIVKISQEERKQHYLEPAEIPEYDIKEEEQRLLTGLETGREARKKDESACSSDEECLSDYCVEGRCTPYPY